MLNPNLLGLLQQQQAGAGAGGAPMNPGALLGGQPMQMPQGGPPPMPPNGSATAAPQPTAPGAMGAAPGGPPQGILPNMTPGQAGAISTGLNTAMASMPHPMGTPAPNGGMTSQGVMQALGGGMGGGMMNPQLLQMLRQGAGYGTA